MRQVAPGGAYGAYRAGTTAADDDPEWTPRCDAAAALVKAATRVTPTSRAR
jgi:hypothetical protein